ncbi:MAG: cytochrome c3 family protein, partial [Deltaproteobacteria bacterium]|nr:cytochrome c3 family protein [Deltaproteobacteria bacterium]
ERGNVKAATCIDCHGGHGARKPRQGAEIDETCGRCHTEISAVFRKSVHGEALSSGNPDVPACTNCHSSHAIPAPKGVGARLDQPDTCGKCHADERRMSKYGVSANVLKTYLSDFHGTTVSLLRSGSAREQPVVALCTDCHGVHDIVKTTAPNSHVLAGNLVRTCQKCHPDANEGFPQAWMSHYEPSWRKAPLVYAMGLFYKVFIPFVICGLVLQIGLHLRKSWGHHR